MEEFPAISKIPRRRLLTVAAAVPVFQKSEARRLGPGSASIQYRMPAGTPTRKRGHANMKVMNGE